MHTHTHTSSSEPIANATRSAPRNGHQATARRGPHAERFRRRRPRRSLSRALARRGGATEGTTNDEYRTRRHDERIAALARRAREGSARRSHKTKGENGTQNATTKRDRGEPRTRRARNPNSEQNEEEKKPTRRGARLLAHRRGEAHGTPRHEHDMARAVTVRTCSRIVAVRWSRWPAGGSGGSGRAGGGGPTSSGGASPDAMWYLRCRSRRPPCGRRRR